MEQFMQRALALARQAEQCGEVPVGAVIVLNDEIVGEGFNQPIQNHDATAHAEIIALRAAGQRLSNYRLTGCDLYVTLEPCAMCATAMVHARIKTCIFASSDPKTGAVQSCLELFKAPIMNHQVEVVSGICADEAGDLLKQFFQQRRIRT